MAIAEIQFSQLESAVLEGQYVGFATAQEFIVPTVRLETKPVGAEFHWFSAGGYATSESGEWGISLSEWEKVLRAVRMLEEIGHPTASTAMSERTGRPNRYRLFPVERAFIEERYEELKAVYGGCYIAVLGRSILDSDPVFSLLAERVYKRFGYRRVYMPLIEESKRVYHIRSPRVRR